VTAWLRGRTPQLAARVRGYDWDVGLVIVCGAAAVFTAYMIWLCVLRYDAFSAARFDLGNMVQAVWSTAHGHLLATTDTSGQQISRLGSHVDPVLAVFAPLWWIWPSPVMLLVAQVVIVATGAVPVYWLGMRWIGDWRIAVACAGTYLLYPPLLGMVLFDFHPVAFATPLLLWCIWAIEERHNALLGIFATLSVLTKEEVGIAVAGLGLWVLIHHRRPRVALYLIIGGLGWSAIAVGLIIPHFAPSGASPFIARYGEFGTSTSSIAKSVVLHPVHALHLLAKGGRRAYVFDLLWPLLFLPLLSPLLLVGAVPELLLNMLTNDSAQYSIHFQYTAVITPFLIAAMIRGVARVRRMHWTSGRILRAPALWVALLLGVSVVAGYRLGPLPLWRHVPGGATWGKDQFTADAHSESLARAAALVPDDVSVSASDPLGSHLSARGRVYTWPVVGNADWVIVDTAEPWLIDRRVQPSAQAAYLEAVRANPAYTLVFDEGGVLAFKRMAAS
jgi:uncharacterized membrane protein